MTRLRAARIAGEDSSSRRLPLPAGALEIARLWKSSEASDRREENSGREEVSFTSASFLFGLRPLWLSGRMRRVGGAQAK